MFGMSEIKISSYDYLAIFCPGIFLTFPSYIKMHATIINCEWLFVLVFLFVSYFNTSLKI